ncbi:MAG TPA: alpha/beta fold hydrolase [bacterium]|nr:alpha/beta fold hydrolase [bacterium]
MSAVRVFHMEVQMFKRKTGLMCRMLLVWMVAGCVTKNTSGPSETTAVRGDAVECKVTRSLSLSSILFLLDESGIEWPYAPQYGIQAYELIYWTEDASGLPIKASAALILPDRDGLFDLVGIQHGTEIKRTRAASRDPLLTGEGMLGILLASMDYAVCVPDYPGLGISEAMHPYVHASLGVAVADAMRAAEQTLETMKNQVHLRFLMGYSEGGYATLAGQKAIESDYGDQMPLTGVIPMAGPYDLAGTMQTLLQNMDYSHPVYIAFLLTAYNRIYGWNRLNDFFLPPYAAQMESLFDGTRSYSEIAAVLPPNLEALLDSSFVEGCLDGTETELLETLRENSLLNWRPRAPVLLIHGDADEVVPYMNALSARDSLSQMGGTVSLVSIPGGTHQSAALPAFLEAVSWLKSLPY